MLTCSRVNAKRGLKQMIAMLGNFGIYSRVGVLQDNVFHSSFENSLGPYRLVSAKSLGRRKPTLSLVPFSNPRIEFRSFSHFACDDDPISSSSAAQDSRSAATSSDIVCQFAVLTITDPTHLYVVSTPATLSILRASKIHLARL